MNWTLDGPFPALSKGRRRGAIFLLLAAEIAELRAFLPLERQMKRTGGPGIIPFELAGSPERAREIMHTWGPAGSTAARRSLFLDYLFPPTYAALQALACAAAADGFAARGRALLAGAGGTIAWAQPAAAAFDYVENTALLLVLADRDHRLPQLARRAALIKFALSSLGLGYILLAGLDAGHERWRG
jgi:hypothetical protein